MIYKSGTLILKGKYRIEELVGQGAFAEVYRVTHVQLNQPYALKVTRPDALGAGVDEVAKYEPRFQLEAELGAKIKDPHVIHAEDFERNKGALILRMEYASGGSLADRIERARKSNQPIPIDEAVKIALDVSDGLAAIHAFDAIHRDLKPSNILFDAQGNAKVSDLGLAQVLGLSSYRTILGSESPPHPGSPPYKSPEQENSSTHLTPASDIYTLGIVLFEVLTGRLYKNIKPGTDIRGLRSDVPGWLRGMLIKMLAENPKDRPWDGAEFAKMLREEKAITQQIDKIAQQPKEIKAESKTEIRPQSSSAQSKPTTDVQQHRDVVVKPPTVQQQPTSNATSSPIIKTPVREDRRKTVVPQKSGLLKSIRSRFEAKYPTSQETRTAVLIYLLWVVGGSISGYIFGLLFVIGTEKQSITLQIIEGLSPLLFQTVYFRFFDRANQGPWTLLGIGGGFCSLVMVYNLYSAVFGNNHSWLGNSMGGVVAMGIVFLFILLITAPKLGRKAIWYSLVNFFGMVLVVFIMVNRGYADEPWILVGGLSCAVSGFALVYWL